MRADVVETVDVRQLLLRSSSAVQWAVSPLLAGLLVRLGSGVVDVVNGCCRQIR